MKVLWFEVTVPSRFSNDGQVLAGWQDSLENIIRSDFSIELYIAFETRDCNCEKKELGNVTYLPMRTETGFVGRLKNKILWQRSIERLKTSMRRILDEVNPDIIHVFGTEWPYGLVAELTEKPVVIHIMGALIPYMNAFYPPGISSSDMKAVLPFWRVLGRLKIMFAYRQNVKSKENERRIWKSVHYYMGRTKWDENLSRILSPSRTYFHVDEALRPEFFSENQQWMCPESSHIRLVSTGCSTFWKGPDMLLKTAAILKEWGVDFEWIVAGKMDETLRKCVERKVGTSFSANNVRLIGFTKPLELKKILIQSLMYVHTAYVENSPNSICEAQLLGVPVVSTYVGGIPTLLQNNGVLVPANDPWQMACAIVDLSKDRNKMKSFSEGGRRLALSRHNPASIQKQLLTCYKDILNMTANKK